MHIHQPPQFLQHLKKLHKISWSPTIRLGSYSLCFSRSHKRTAYCKCNFKTCCKFYTSWIFTCLFMLFSLSGIVLGCLNINQSPKSYLKISQILIFFFMSLITNKGNSFIPRSRNHKSLHSLFCFVLFTSWIPSFKTCKEQHPWRTQNQKVNIDTTLSAFFVHVSLFFCFLRIYHSCCLPNN